MSPKHLKNDKSNDYNAEKLNGGSPEATRQAMEQEHEDKAVPPVINEESPVQDGHHLDVVRVPTTQTALRQDLRDEEAHTN